MLLISSSVFFSGLNRVSKDFRLSPHSNLPIRQHSVIVSAVSNEEAPHIVCVAVGDRNHRHLRVKLLTPI